MADGQLEFAVILVIAALFMSSFFIGRSLNYRKQRAYYRLLVQEIRPFSKTLTYKRYGPSAFSYALPPFTEKSDPFKKLEFSVTLLDRENFLHYAFSKLRGGNDRTIVKADLKSKPNLRFEMFSKKGAAHKMAKRVSAEGLKSVKNREMSGDFLLRSTDPTVAEKALSVMLRTAEFDEVRPFLEHFSLSSESPHMVLIYVNKGEYAGLFRFLWDYGRIMNDTFSKIISHR